MFTLTAQPPLFIFKGLGAPAGPGEIFTYAVIDTTLMHRRVLSYLVMWSLPLTRFPLLIIPPFPFPALVCSSHSNSSNIGSLGRTGIRTCTCSPTHTCSSSSSSSNSSSSSSSRMMMVMIMMMMMMMMMMCW